MIKVLITVLQFCTSDMCTLCLKSKCKIVHIIIINDYFPSQAFRLDNYMNRNKRIAISNSTSCIGLKEKLLGPVQPIPENRNVNDDGILLLLLKHVDEFSGTDDAGDETDMIIQESTEKPKKSDKKEKIEKTEKTEKTEKPKYPDKLENTKKSKNSDKQVQKNVLVQDNTKKLGKNSEYQPHKDRSGFDPKDLPNAYWTGIRKW